MSAEIVHQASFAADGLVVIDASGAAWIAFAAPWWRLDRWCWRALTSGHRAWLMLTTSDGKRVRVLAIRFAREVLTIGSHKSS